MLGWAQMSKVQRFLNQTEVAKDMERCHHMVTDCLATFEPISQPEMHEWQAQFKLNTKADHREVVEYLVNVENSQTITNDALQCQSADISRMMSLMQRMLSANPETASRPYIGLSSNLYDLQLKSLEQLPDFHLRSGEVVRIGQFPVSGTSAMDIYEGKYLGREKVAIKVVRAVNVDETTTRRFKRECEIWKELWKIDQGKHILPFYGFCDEDGPFPYMVSPWQNHGTALTYIKRQDDRIDYIELVKGVALGLQVLHSMTTAVVHGDLKATNIVIDDAGNPLIADFGLSRLVEDITGIPFSHSRGAGVSDSYRWCAPEVCTGQDVLSLSSDVYAYGMTVLELFTHEPPYNNIKHTTEVMIRSSKGEHPMRPTNAKIITRGLDENMWKFLCLCWATEPSQRPTIQQVLAMFPQRSEPVIVHPEEPTMLQNRLPPLTPSSENNPVLTLVPHIEPTQSNDTGANAEDGERTDFDYEEEAMPEVKHILVELTDRRRKDDDLINAAPNEDGTNAEKERRDFGTSVLNIENSHTVTNDASQTTNIEEYPPTAFHPPSQDEENAGDSEPGDPDVSVNMNCDLSAVLSRLILLLRDPESYKRFLSCRGTDAQRRLDLLQDLLDLDYFPAMKPLIIKALFRLCRASGLHPRCFALPGLPTVGQQVTGGGFGDIWKGLVHGHTVCVKVMRIFEDSNLDAVLKVCSPLRG
ncbi:kinase-like domain-containing protein [Mycena capillaripes]|nr:kinase-like domain-containing protein [Mycena capillaripes]